MDLKKTIAVVFGGVSSEHEVSRNSAFSILSNLDKNKYEIITVGITKDGRWLFTEAPYDEIKSGRWENHKSNKTTFLSLDRGSNRLILLESGDCSYSEHCNFRKIDCLWPVLHGKNGEDGTIQGICQMAGIDFVGSDTCSSALCMDKIHTKNMASSKGIKQAKYMCAYMTEYKNSSIELVERVDVFFKKYPLFVKPARSGSSVGISRVECKKQLSEAFQNAFEEDTKIVIEEGIFGRELEVSVLGNDMPKTSCVGEVLSQNTWYDYDTKYLSDDLQTQIPACLEKNMADYIRKKAIEIYKLFGCKGLSRVDFFQDENNELFFNEINTLPGFTEVSMYPKLWEESGLSYTELLDEIIEYSFNK